MPIAGFAFTKLSAERTEGKGAQINVENNVQITSMEDVKIGFETEKQKTVKIKFEFVSKFEQDYGTIALTGETLFVTEDKKAKDMVKEWKKDKKINPEVMPEIMNAILHRCNVQAIIMAKDVNLPSPIPLPKVNVQ